MSKQVSEYRAEVIEKTINIEWIMSGIISQRYFGRVAKEFLLEVLYDEYCSFALKRRILEKVVKDLDGRKLQELNRVNTIRNYFAHCNQQIFEGPDVPPEGAEGQVVDPRKLDRVIDFEGLYNEFSQIEGPICKYLYAIYQNMGGESYMYKDGEFVKAVKETEE